eukprot:gene3635-6451_t
MWWLLLLTPIVVYLITFLYFNGFSNKKGEPVYIRGFIPMVGAALDIAKAGGIYPFVKENAEKYGNIFTVHLFGKRIHIISDVNSYASMQKKPRVFSFTPLMHEMSQRMNGEVVDDSDLDPEKLRGTSMSISKYLQGESLEALTKVYARLTLKKLNEYFEEHNIDGELVVDLHSFIRTVLYYASSKSMLGEDFDSDSTQKDFFTFDDSLKFVANGFPRFLINHVFEARKRILKKIEQLDLTKACDFVGVLAEEAPKSQTASVGFSMLNASQTNTINASFWTFYEIMRDQETKEKVMAEITDKFSIDHYEDSINSMENLQGAYLEANRFHNVGISLRQTMEDTTVEVNAKKYNLRKGDRVFMIPVSYQDPELYPNPKKYDPNRYKGKIPEKVKNSQIPYGGGIHLCPGRYFAINEIKLFVVLMLKHFKCELVEEKSIDNDFQSFAYLPPNGDVKMKISRINS